MESVKKTVMRRKKKGSGVTLEIVKDEENNWIKKWVGGRGRGEGRGEGGGRRGGGEGGEERRRRWRREGGGKSRQISKSGGFGSGGTENNANRKGVDGKDKVNGKEDKDKRWHGRQFKKNRESYGFVTKVGLSRLWLKLPLLYAESTWHIHFPVSKTDVFPASDYRVGYH